MNRDRADIFFVAPTVDEPQDNGDPTRDPDELKGPVDVLDEYQLDMSGRLEEFCLYRQLDREEIGYHEEADDLRSEPGQ